MRFLKMKPLVVACLALFCIAHVKQVTGAPSTAGLKQETGTFVQNLFGNLSSYLSGIFRELGEMASAKTRSYLGRPYERPSGPYHDPYPPSQNSYPPSHNSYPPSQGSYRPESNDQTDYYNDTAILDDNGGVYFNAPQAHVNVDGRPHGDRLDVRGPDHSGLHINRDKDRSQIKVRAPYGGVDINDEGHEGGVRVRGPHFDLNMGGSFPNGDDHTYDGK